MGKTIKNIITGKEITKPDPLDIEVPFDGGVMITETDTAGIITYVKGVWETVKGGNYWEGFVKNMTSEGKYYLVVVWIKPKLDDDGNIIGYIAGRKIPDKDLMQRALDQYKVMMHDEH
jgi:hypothetical protein